MTIESALIQDLDPGFSTLVRTSPEKVESAIPELKLQVVQKFYAITNLEEVQEKIKALDSDIEPLMLVDENDMPILDANGGYLTALRKVFKKNLAAIPEAKKQALFCRVAFFLLEDENGNIIISQRASEKDPINGGKLEMAGGHVVAGDSYLKTINKEVGEELKLLPGQYAPVTQEDQILKDRTFTPGKGDTKGTGSICPVYRVIVPNQEALTPDPKEIASLTTLSKEELLAVISAGSLDEEKKSYVVNINGQERSFVPYMAHWYLEYLGQCGMDVEKPLHILKEAGVMNNRTRMVTPTNS